MPGCSGGQTRGTENHLMDLIIGSRKVIRQRAPLMLSEAGAVFCGSLAPSRIRTNSFLRTGFGPVLKIQREPAKREENGGKWGACADNPVLKIRRALHQVEWRIRAQIHA